ncbi:NAD(P)H-dependent oxidoreductase [Pseudoalteromonas citrea]|uniref:NAD(P)H-dependent oxidoreductase n=1 Tax=Pseudoalteromonas citrea TaxID=43655 RepID=A0A5S3XQQ2_9GAMM|nr:nitroreductase family protein [Pseudoalteromonas citrea]TMP42523.1 NAD(P)H-dependent oxidoreductase [Pseudoalteromonas citrea]TMP59298.1 NAD(P)H-dependent oxidoreductase [Pseudoalteromonas citrea]
MNTHLTVSQGLTWRYAVRRFSDKKVSKTDLQQLLTMTGLSASSYGLQPYKVIVIENPQVKKSLVGHSYGQHKIAENSHLLVLAADMSNVTDMVLGYMQSLSKKGHLTVTQRQTMQENMLASLTTMTIEQQFQWASVQASIALGTLLVSAASLEIDSCPIGGIDGDGYDDVLGLPMRDLKTVIAVPIGYRHSDDVNAHTPKIRKSLEQLVIEI